MVFIEHQLITMWDLIIWVFEYTFEMVMKCSMLQEKMSFYAMNCTSVELNCRICCVWHLLRKRVYNIHVWDENDIIGKHVVGH